jgi:hypothetical protein
MYGTHQGNQGYQNYNDYRLCSDTRRLRIQTLQELEEGVTDGLAER